MSDSEFGGLENLGSDMASLPCYRATAALGAVFPADPG